MPVFHRCASAWPVIVVGVVLSASLGEPALGETASGSAPLTLEEVQRLVLDGQPALLAEAASGRAFQAEAIAAGQLPDPQLIAGISQVPVEGSESLSLRDDDFTALSVGLAQEFPRAEKRELRAALMAGRAEGSAQALAGLARRLRLESGRAYLEVVAAAEGARLIEASEAEALRQRDAAGIDLVAGRNDQSQLLAATVEAAVAADRARAFRQRELTGRAVLARWIGPAAEGPVDPAVPVLPGPPALGVLLDSLSAHPDVARPATDATVAATELRLARAALKPDWRMEVRYDHRLEYPDLVTLMVGVDLPVFPADRQDRSSAAALQRLSAAGAERDDRLREATATVTAAYRQWVAGRERLGRFDESLLPPGAARVDAALASYRAGHGSLSAVLEARRSLLDTHLMRLELAIDAARQRLQLQYFEMETE